MTFTVKSIPDSDIERVLEIYRQGVDEGRATFNTEVPSRQRWDESHLKICRLGAYLEDGSLAGWIALSPTSSRRCYVGVTEVSLYVDAVFRGMGVGNLLMKSLVEESEKRGIWSLYAAILPRIGRA